MKKILSTLILSLAVVSTGAFAAETTTKPVDTKSTTVVAKDSSHKTHAKKHHKHKKSTVAKEVKAADSKDVKTSK